LTLPEEKEIIQYAKKICAELSEEELKKVITLTEDEYWNGPVGLGERAIDVLLCNKKSVSIADEILKNKDYPISIRGFCLYYVYKGNDDFLVEKKEELIQDSQIGEVIKWYFKEE